jgi:hypothetical protein
MMYVILEKDGKVSKCHVIGQGQVDAGIDIEDGVYFTSFAQTQVLFHTYSAILVLFFTSN